MRLQSPRLLQGLPQLWVLGQPVELAELEKRNGSVGLVVGKVLAEMTGGRKTYLVTLRCLENPHELTVRETLVFWILGEEVRVIEIQGDRRPSVRKYQLSQTPVGHALG